MDKIKMASGASYDCAKCETIPGMAFIAIPGTDFNKAAQIFGNPNSTRRMEYGRFVLNGFTELADLSKQEYGILATLKGGTVTEANNNA